MTDVTKLGTLPAWLGTSASMAWHMDLDMDSHMACLWTQQEGRARERKSIEREWEGES